MGIAENLKRLRSAAGLSQAGLAKKAGVAQQLISQIESGKNTTTKYLPRIATALGARVEEIDPQFAGVIASGDDPHQKQIDELAQIYRDLADSPEWQQHLMDFARQVGSRGQKPAPQTTPRREDDKG